MTAAQQGHVLAVKELLAADANVHATRKVSQRRPCLHAGRTNKRANRMHVRTITQA